MASLQRDGKQTGWGQAEAVHFVMRTVRCTLWTLQTYALAKIANTVVVQICAVVTAPAD
jgi:hypothetical protein